MRNLSKPGRYADGNGLYLVVEGSGAKRWLLRTVIQGRRRDIGLGSARVVSLSEAREQARVYRRIARSGGDPLADRRKARKVVPTFEDAARTVHSEHSNAWRNHKHADQWLSTLERYVLPTIGTRRVDGVDTPELLKVLSPIWLTKPETARRVRQRIRSVLDWAKASGFREGDNPADSVTKALPKQPDRSRHYAAMPFGEIPAFISALSKSGAGEAATLALEFLILTAARTGEVLGARWDEIDMDQEIWTIPGHRIKSGREHRVPLVPRCVQILRRAKALSTESEFVFPGRAPEKPMSNMVFLMVLRRMKLKATAHGFRSAFRDWAAERTNFPREVCEMALAHTIKSKAEAAYRRGDLLEKRRKLMSTWADFVGSASAQIVKLRAG